MDDLISRQAAIDAIEIEIDSIDHIPRWFTERMTGVLERLPSAQPEAKPPKWVIEKKVGFR